MKSVLSPLKLRVRNPIHDEVYSIQHYVIKFVSDLQLVSGFLQILLFPPPIKLLLKVALNTINLKPKPVSYLVNKIIYFILTVATCCCEVAPSIFPGSPTGGCLSTFIVVMLFPCLVVSALFSGSNLPFLVVFDCAPAPS